MKKTLLVFTLIISFSVVVKSQSAGSSNCYLDWAKVFEERGAEDVPDGTYSDVIITIRSGDDADCFYGKCDVKGGQIKAMYIKLEDGKYELLQRRPRYSDIPITINNGISKVLLTMEDDLINVMFIKKIKPKKAGFEKAALPSDF